MCIYIYKYAWTVYVHVSVVIQTECDMYSGNDGLDGSDGEDGGPGESGAEGAEFDVRVEFLKHDVSTKRGHFRSRRFAPGAKQRNRRSQFLTRTAHYSWMDRVVKVGMVETVVMVAWAGTAQRDLQTSPEVKEGMEATPVKAEAEAKVEKVPKLPSTPSRNINLC